MPPLRTCLGCRGVRPKSDLVRFVADSGALRRDILGRLKGRGAYLCPLKGCVEAALRKKGSFSRALRSTVVAPEPGELWLLLSALSVP